MSLKVKDEKDVRLSVGRVWNIQWVRAVIGCAAFLGMIAGAAAQKTAATQTTLAVATDDVGPRTKATLTAHVSAETSGAPTGVVNFRSGETDLGSAIVDAEGNAHLQTDVFSIGIHQVVAVYQGQSAYQASTSKAEQLEAHASTVAGYTVTAAPTSLTTVVGGFAESVITVTPNNGFNAYVSLSCNGLPVNTTCTFTPLNVPAICTSTTACTPGTSVVQIQTQAPSPGATAFVFPLLLGLAGLGACKRRAWRNLALGLVVFSGAMGMTACNARYNYLHHGPPENPGTPEGTYTVTIAAQSATGAEMTTPPTSPQLTLAVTAPK
jgi:Bacterial Ig-like domain (group 3)